MLRIMDEDKKIYIQTDYLQKPNLWHNCIPHDSFVQEQGTLLFEEIHENLSQILQSGEFIPGFPFWTSRLKTFLSLHGLYFSKQDHLRLINLYLSIVAIEELNYEMAVLCFSVLVDLLYHKTRHIDREDLTIDWRLFYRWLKLVDDNHDVEHGLVILPKDFKVTCHWCTMECSRYFAVTATEEILAELRPQMCPFDFDFFRLTSILSSLLPVDLPPQYHHQGYKLWLAEFFGIWENLYNNQVWELCLIRLFAFVAWYNIGYIDWEPWFSKIFTRILRGFALPIGELQMKTSSYSYLILSISQWIVAMIGNGNSCLQYLHDLLMAMKSFYYPSNTGQFQNDLVNFILKLTDFFVQRVRLERKQPSSWSFRPHPSYYLTDRDIHDFVDCVKDYALVSIFNKSGVQEAADTCQYLSILQPEAIVPIIAEKLLSSTDNTTEPHRFTSIMTCLTRITRQLVRQTSTFSQGQTFVLPILMAVLPGIDLNDFDKTSITLTFLDTIFNVVSCVDCSSAVDTRKDLTEIEKIVCRSTSKFVDFINEFLDRIFRMIQILATDVAEIDKTNRDNEELVNRLASIMTRIAEQCSEEIFKLIREKISELFHRVFLSPKVRQLLAALIHALVRANPSETLEYFFPLTCQSIEKIERTDFMTNHEGDLELTWHLTLFSELVHARGDVLLPYQSMIMTIFDRCVRIIHKDSYEAIGKAASYLLQSLCYSYAIYDRSIIDQIDDLPIRTWGQPIDIERCRVKFHLPSVEEINFACQFIERFLYAELRLLKEHHQTMSKQERLRSLSMIDDIIWGCFRLVPPVVAEPVPKLYPSVVPLHSKSYAQLPIYPTASEFKEQIRLRLIEDMGEFLDQMIEIQSDDVCSIEKAIEIYARSSLFYGISHLKRSRHENYLRNLQRNLRNPLVDCQRTLYPLALRKIVRHCETLDCSFVGELTTIDRDVILKLFQLSTYRYSGVRRVAQKELFDFVDRFKYSFLLVIDPLLDLLNSADQIDHDRIKGCLYVLLGNSTFFILAQKSWTMVEQLWPAIAGTKQATKLSTQNLLTQIQAKLRRLFLPYDVVHHRKPIDHIKSIDNIKLYHCLMEKINALLIDDALNWNQQKMAMLMLTLLFRKDVPIPSSCVRTFTQHLTHKNTEIRQFAINGLVSLCHLQKPRGIVIEKAREEIHPSLIDISNPYPGDREDNLWLTMTNDDLVQTQTEWEEQCFLNKPSHGYYTWPKQIKYTLNKRQRHDDEQHMSESIKIIYDNFREKNFLEKMVQQMVDSATNFDQKRFTMFKSLFRNFGFAFVNDFMEVLYVLIHEPNKEKQNGCHCLAAEMVAGMIRGSKSWTLIMLDDLWLKLRPFLTEVCLDLTTDLTNQWTCCFHFSMINTDPRQMSRPIEFLRSLLSFDQSNSMSSNETSRWYLITQLKVFQWRIPSIWFEIQKNAKDFLDHSSERVRHSIANILAISFSFDVKIVDGQSNRQPTMDEFLVDLQQRLEKAMEISAQHPLNNFEMDDEASLAWNFIGTIIQMNHSVFIQSPQPMKDVVIRLFPYLCQIESLVANDEQMNSKLNLSRLSVGMTYLHDQYLDKLIGQIEEICSSPKWHSRRAAIEFLQSMIFCNLFNARPYAQRLRTLIIRCLFDEQLEVRTMASTTLTGFYCCSFLPVLTEDLIYFTKMSQTQYLTWLDERKVKSTKLIVKRHAGVLGLCAIVSSSPYDVPKHVPQALMYLCQRSIDPYVIQKSIRQCLLEFHRTHRDSWREHREKFTEDQLMILSDALVSQNYYA